MSKLDMVAERRSANASRAGLRNTAERKATMEILNRETTRLQRALRSKPPVSAGEIAPDFTLGTTNGESLSLYQVLSGGAVVLYFMRGRWCPFSELQLRGLERSLAEISARGATVIAVSPRDAPLHYPSTTTVEPGIPFLIDPEAKAASLYGVAAGIGYEMASIYRRAGLQLPKTPNRENEYRIVIPATFVIGADKLVLCSYADADYTNQAPLGDIVESLSK